MIQYISNINFYKSILGSKIFKSIIIGLLFLITHFLTGKVYCQNVIVLDQTHYSEILGEFRNYRVFLPPKYYEQSEIKYPVIYFYHGWSERYFGSINDSDEGRNEKEMISNFVSNNQVIVVKPDGYNRDMNEDYYLRPYNIGPVETHRQFPLYFPELLKHIDQKFRTIPDREHRAISGFSMGGFMAFWISGKYPDLVSAAGSFCGSEEFVVGNKDFSVEYRHKEMYQNYDGVNLRLNYGDKDFIRAYHKDLNMVWTQLMNNYEYKIYDAAHTITGLTDMFGFFMDNFKNPAPSPKEWNHIDVYPGFSVWDYQVESDRMTSGFTVLENVTIQGFKCSVKTFLPDGELMPFVNLTVTTAPIYEKNQLYKIHDVDVLNKHSNIRIIRSDANGRLRISLNGGIHEVGITMKEEEPNLVFTISKVNNLNWATHNKMMNLSIQLLNKGSKAAEDVTVNLKAARKSITVYKSEVKFGKIEVGEISTSNTSFKILETDNKIEIERLYLTISDGEGNKWDTAIDIQIRPFGPEMDYIIADGKEFMVADSGNKIKNIMLGKGNGDGKANPGESIVILIEDAGVLHRASLYTEDAFVNPGGISVRESIPWGSFDHVGGSAKYSVPIMSANCPQKHKISFFTEYWLPSYPDHIIKQGVINVEVSGTDNTPPELIMVELLGDNTIHAKIYDGGNISSVNARFYLKDEITPSFILELNNKGEIGDKIKGDLVFGGKIPVMGFERYKIEIEAIDQNGNRMVTMWQKIFSIH